MFKSKNRSFNGRQIYRLNKIRTLAVLILIFFTVTVSIIAGTKGKSSTNNTARELLRVWSAGDYEKVYDISRKALNDKPLDYFLLTMNGFSSYQIGISQINNHNTLFYIDECIRSLRKALLLKDAGKDGRVYYVLGKAYSYKGNEYSDLTIKYLEMANNAGFEAKDIPEYLGLAYAICGDYRSSVKAFSEVLDTENPPTDIMLLSIARSYIAMEDFNMAIGYLQHCVETSPDSKSVNIARLLLAEIYIHLGDLNSAEFNYLSILENSGESAEVRYQLGELFLLKGDAARARAEWRNAYRQDPTHVKARARLNI
jgi:tetratricopeptide (TPR) repeat protein